LTVQDVIQQEFPRVAPTPVSMIELDAKVAKNDQAILRHQNLLEGLQNTEAAYASSINLSAEVAKTDQAI
jgi:succinyl-CoA synthetase beta subunit